MLLLLFSLIVALAVFLCELAGLRPTAAEKTAGAELVEPASAPQSIPPYPLVKLQHKDIGAALKELATYTFKIVTRRSYVIRSIPSLSEQDKRFDDFLKFIAVSTLGYWDAGWISDYYNEKCRIDCRRYDSKLSLREAWAIHGNGIVAKHPTNLHDQVEALYSIEFGCNTFRPALVVGAVKYFNVKRPGADREGLIAKESGYPARFLDFSAGWGDRLIGCIAAGIGYIGVDPNPCTHRGYAKIIKSIGDPARHQVIQAPFEVVPQQDLGRADIVMTSPPYFDLEDYTSADGQSIKSFSTEDSWLNGFLFPSLAKCWEALRPGGVLILVINDKAKPSAGEKGYSIPARDYVTRLPRALYRGLIPYAKEFLTPKGPSYAPPQPMFVWQKMVNVSAGQTGGCRLGQDHYSACVPEWIGADLQEAVWNAEDSLAESLTVDGLRGSRAREIKWKSVETYTHAADPGIILGETLWLGRTQGLVAYAGVAVNPNPPFVVETHQNFKVIRDDLLPGGTKQRGHGFLGDMPGDGPIVYAGTYGGFCHVAYAVSCWFHRRPFVAFLARSDYPTNILAKRFGAIIMEIPGAPYPGLKKYAEDWAVANNGTFVRGLYGPEYEPYLVGSIREHKIDGQEHSAPLVFWLGATSAMLAKALTVVYPRCFINLVHLGKHDYNEELPEGRFRIWKTEEDFLEPARNPPPFPSVALYEAKVWAVAKANASAEDYIWSTGAE